MSILWIVNPEIRRLYDWRFGFSAIEFISLLPLFAMVPHMWALTFGGTWRRLSRPFVIATWFWLSGFSYALFLAFLAGNVVPALYSFANFIFPMALGLWIAADTCASALAYQRMTRVLFWLTTFVSVYAVVQYVIVPPWDAAWLQNVIAHGETAFGRPLPFQIRVYSVLNSPGPFGSYMAIALMIALPQLSLRRPWELAQIPIWLIAFGLSLDRSGWLTFAVGAAVYLVLAPRRGPLLTSVALSCAMLWGVVSILPSLVGSDAIVTGLVDRFSTFSRLDEDQSGAARLDTYSQGISLVATTPLGLGLGVTGTATKLGAAETSNSVDSGVLSRLVEMGMMGAAIQVASFAVMLSTLLSLWIGGGRRRDVRIQSIASMAIGVEVALFSSQLSGDITGMLVFLLWLVMGMALKSDRTALTCVRPQRAGHGVLPVARSVIFS